MAKKRKQWGPRQPNVALHRPHLSDPPAKVKPDHRKVLWCPYCDWRHSDSFTGRKRMGNHLVDEHTEDVLFEQGEAPPDMED